MTVSEWLVSAVARLKEAGIESSALEAQVLLSEALGVKRTWVLAHPESSGDFGLAEEWLARRATREPLAYIIGWREFYGRRFAVGPGVLVPRQETETLVEAALAEKCQGPVLDLGTGSGCIAITLKLERPSWRVVASDVSPEALEIASENASRLGASVDFVLSDGFASFPDSAFELIVSNPPYIGLSESLMPEVVEHEPSVALFAGKDGLDFYRRLALEAKRCLRPDGRLLMEVGYTQAGAVTAIFERDGWTALQGELDLSGVARVVTSRAPPPRDLPPPTPSLKDEPF